MGEEGQEDMLEEGDQNTMLFTSMPFSPHHFDPSSDPI